MSNTINFLGIGTAKGGTTSVYDILKQHPDIYLPEIKEVHFFDYKDNFSKGKDWYLNLAFRGVKEELIKGEITPCYMFSDDAPERILKTLGKDVLLFVILRNPADRAFSHYNMLKARGLESESFEMALLLEEQRMNNSERDYFRFSYLSRGYYYKQLKRYFEYFNKEQIKVILFEDFIENKESTISDLLHFLGVNTVSVVDMELNIKSNDAGVARIKFLDKVIYNDFFKSSLRKILTNDFLRKNLKRKVKFLNRKKGKSQKLESHKRKEIIDKFFLNDIKELEILLNRDLSLWY